MPLIVFHTRKVREALKAQAAWSIDLLLLGGVAAIIGALFMFTKEIAAPATQGVTINLSFWALPKYTLFSLSRGFAAYVLSLAFTLIYGTVAAHNRRAERIMLPALDILQAIPVLTILPGLVLLMISLFPGQELGLELACIIMIFSAQVWNMTFSFHGSLRSIPKALREVAKINGLTGWQIFRQLEVPAAMIGLVWNSMMSMAGGWFFLTYNEAFSLHGRDFRLPGIGSYMQEAINQGDIPAMVAAVIAMIIMIVVVDQVFWRPIVVWAQRFKLEDSAGADVPQSWLLNLLAHSRFYSWLSKDTGKNAKPSKNGKKRWEFIRRRPAGNDRIWKALRKILGVAVQLALLFVVLWGLWALIRLLIAVPLHNPKTTDYVDIVLALLASFARTSAALIIGVAWTLPVGIWIGLSPTLSRRLQPIIQVVASFPAPMLFPLVTMLILFAHIPFTAGCVALMLLGAQWYILFNVIAGATAIPDDLKEVAGVYSMPRWQRWRKLYLPCVFPYLVTGLVTAAGGAWNATIASEIVMFKGHTFLAFGLGSMIYNASNDANFPLLTAATVCMALAVVLINRLLWKRMYRLAEERYALIA